MAVFRVQDGISGLTIPGFYWYHPHIHGFTAPQTGGMVGTGLADLGAANARLFGPDGLPAVSVALGWSALGTGRQVLMQQRTTDAFRGRVFGAFSAVQGAALPTGFMLGGVLGERLGLVLLLSVGGLLRVLAGALTIWLLPRATDDLNDAS